MHVHGSLGNLDVTCDTNDDIYYLWCYSHGRWHVALPFTCFRTDSERIVHKRVNTAPFVLVGADETAVNVLCPLQASGEHMEVTHEKFHQVNYGLGDIVGQYLSGEKLKGQLETEKMLKVCC